MAGGVVSRTVTVNEFLPMLPRVSVAWQFTVVVPKPKVEPDAGVQVTGRLPSTISFAVTVKLTAAPLGPVASTIMSPGSLTAGPMVSTTVTVKLPVVVRLASFVALQLTVVVPMPNTEPDGGVQVTVPS